MNPWGYNPCYIRKEFIVTIYILIELFIINISTKEIQRICLPMKESNIIVGNVANNFLRRDPLLNTKGQYMKESNILVGNAAYNFFIREVS